MTKINLKDNKYAENHKSEAERRAEEKERDG